MVISNTKYKQIFLFTGSLWKKTKESLGFGVDEKAAEHKDQFVLLVRELKSILRADNRLVTFGVMPHVNTTGGFLLVLIQLYYNL